MLRAVESTAGHLLCADLINDFIDLELSAHCVPLGIERSPDHLHTPATVSCGMLPLRCQALPMIFATDQPAQRDLLKGCLKADLRCWHMCFDVMIPQLTTVLASIQSSARAKASSHVCKRDF